MNKQRGFLVVAILISVALTTLMILPFLQYILGALFLGYLLYPLHERLRNVIPPMASGITIIIGAFLTIILPVLLASSVILRQAAQLPEMLAKIELHETEQMILSLTGIRIELVSITNQAMQGFAETVFASPSEILSVVIKIVLGVTLLVFLLYYILMEGEAFVAWVSNIIPLPNDVTMKLLEEIEETTWAVIIGHIFVAIAQAVVAGIGLAIAGVPNVVFWTFVMVILAFLPIIGVILVWGPAAIYLFTIGNVPQSVFLVVYGILVVGLIDNYLRSIVVDYHTEEPLNPGVILIGVLGGIYAIGFMGLFIGPIVIGFLKAILGVFKEDYEAL